MKSERQGEVSRAGTEASWGQWLGLRVAWARWRQEEGCTWSWCGCPPQGSCKGCMLGWQLEEEAEVEAFREDLKQ